MNEFEEMANEFAKKHNVKLTILDSEFRPYWHDDKQSRWVFKCRISRNRKSYTFTFGQSLLAGNRNPTMYEVLAVFVKSDCGLETFEDFCSCFGYNVDSRAIEQMYKNCCKEYKAMERLFGDIMDELREFY